jgi:AraC family transcriptional regulator of adaptative response/methylated-DNA-[protein]-cysteine methyltransferase
MNRHPNLEVKIMAAENTQIQDRPAPPSDARWEAVLARDAHYDGAFVYAVRSTRIYCQPSCPSRRPGREQVVFFPTADAAEAAGFRACRRCKPDEPDARVVLVRRICRHIDGLADEPPDLKALGVFAGLSPSHLSRLFKRVTGITPREYADTRRLERLKLRLAEGRTVTTALYSAGYGSSSRLYERSDAQLGMTPAAYRRGGRGEQIRYTIQDSPLGRILVAATAKGLCAVYLGDEDSQMEAALRRHYPAAQLVSDPGGLGESVAALMHHLDGELPHLDLPLDVRATAFQRRVWDQLQAIPPGETRSYSDIARAVGQPKACRAVARACADNRVALLIPCHRVVREDGQLGGYRWGVERKRALLERELREKPIPGETGGVACRDQEAFPTGSSGSIGPNSIAVSTGEGPPRRRKS